MIALEMKIMNNIAYFLASRYTDTVAVSLRKNLPLTFVLAKGRGTVPDKKDIASARAFFSSMRDASTWKDVLPSIISHGADRVNAALVALASFQFDGLVPGKHRYVPGALNEEFEEPVAERLAEFFSTREPFDILVRLFHRVREHASFEVDPNCTKDSDELKTQLDKFTALNGTAECLLKSTFLTKNIDIEADWALEYRSRVEQVTCYVHGIGQLINLRRRYIKAGSDIPYAWLEEYSDQETKDAELQLSDSAWTAVKNLADKGLLRSYQFVSSDEYNANPMSSQLESQWVSAVRHVRHVVPRMIIHLDDDSDYTVNPRIIGTSAQLCVCCAQWLKKYNDDFMTYPKPPTWKASKPILSMDFGVDWGLEQKSNGRSRRADDAVFGMVLTGVTRVLENVGLLRKELPPARDNLQWDSVSESESESEYEFDFGSPRW
jgi:hypothetical protein